MARTGFLVAELGIHRAYLGSKVAELAELGSKVAE